MYFSIEDIKGRGNGAIFFRLRSLGQYWNWSTLSWVGSESSSTKLFATEYSESDPDFSSYAVTSAVPAGSFLVQAVLDSTGEVLGVDMTTENDISVRLGTPSQTGDPVTLTGAYDAAKTAATQTSVNAIPTNPLLTNDVRLPATVIAAKSDLVDPDNAGISAIKAKTDNLPAQPAAVGSAMTLTSAYDAAKTAATQSSVDTANSYLNEIWTALVNIGQTIWTYATRKLTSAYTDETNPRDMAAGGPMAGSNAVTITVDQTATVTPIPDVFITILDSTKTVTLGVVKTNSNGQTKDNTGADLVMLDPVAGGYFLNLRKAGVVFSQTALSQADVLAGSKTVYGSQFVPTPANPGFQNVYGQVINQDGSPAVGIPVVAKISAHGQMLAGVFISSDIEKVVTDSSGYFQIQLPLGAEEVITINNQGQYEITVAPDPNAPLSDSRALSSYFE